MEVVAKIENCAPFCQNHIAAPELNPVFAALLKNERISIRGNENPTCAWL